MKSKFWGKPLFILFLLLNIGQAAAQQSSLEEIKPFRIGAGLGGSFSGYRDETDIPVNRYINTLIFIIDGNIEKGSFFYSFNFGFLSGKNNLIEINSGDDFFVYYQRGASFFRSYLENALDYRLWGNRTFPGYLGGALRCDVYFAHLQQTVYYNLTAIVSLNVHVTQKWIINADNKFVFSVSLPIFGYAIRPPYYGLLYSPFDLENRITSIHNYLAVFGDLKYQYKINDLFSLYSGLGFELSRISFPQPRTDAAFRLNAGVAFTF